MSQLLYVPSLYVPGILCPKFVSPIFLGDQCKSFSRIHDQIVCSQLFYILSVFRRLNILKFLDSLIDKKCLLNVSNRYAYVFSNVSASQITLSSFCEDNVPYKNFSTNPLICQQGLSQDI